MHAERISRHFILNFEAHVGNIFSIKSSRLLCGISDFCHYLVDCSVVLLLFLTLLTNRPLHKTDFTQEISFC